MKKLDLTPRSPELLSKAYDLAKRVYDRALWEEMEERQLLAVELKDGRKRVLSVMGGQGTHLAIALYPSKAEFERLHAIDDNDIHDIQDAFFGLNHLQLAFGPASELQEGEMKDVRASGVKFKRGVNPTFVSYVAGFAPARMGGEEMAEAVEILEAFLTYLDKFGSESLPVLTHTSQLLQTWIEDASGVWTKGENDYSGCLPVAVNMNESLVSRVAALPVKKGLFLEIGAFVIPLGRGVDKRGKMSRLLLAVDGPTQLVLDTDIIVAPDDSEFDWTEAVDFVLNTMIKLDCRPQNLAVFGHNLHGVVKKLTRNYFHGTKFWDDCPCDSAHEAFEFMAERIGM